MYYWNRPNFEGLIQLAEALEEDSRLAQLAEYCRHRERGLRRKAFEALDTFIAVTETWRPVEARDACQRILELNALTPQAHQFVTQPLLTRFILPVLNAWVADEPASQTALRWLGILRRDSGLLRKALALSPDDVPVRRHLVLWWLSDVDYATHHLVESQLLGDLDATKRVAGARPVAAPTNGQRLCITTSSNTGSRSLRMGHAIHRVRHFEIVGPYALSVRFEDDTEQPIDVRPLLEGEVLHPQDLKLFNAVELDPRARNNNLNRGELLSRPHATSL